ncbi:hypothetical protein [Luteimonas huabeiensis]|uniref:hypothetical protein n=1 Tax=Luteimonas huabeiensis TaxID=1244513 RepID=UPI00046436AD|nr:hypothetical protein [Luteimonas huabeiensis]
MYDVHAASARRELLAQALQAARLLAPSAVPRNVRRARDFGVGYGESSGYRHAARYAAVPAMASRFRLS